MQGKWLLLALAAALVSLNCASGVMAGPDSSATSKSLYHNPDDKYLSDDFCEGPQKAMVVTEQPACWSLENDILCAKACQQAKPYRRYKAGNWGLFPNEKGVVCCCAMPNKLFGSKIGNYKIVEPYISPAMQKSMGIKPTDPLK